MEKKNLSVVMLGASGAVGTEALQTLLKSKQLKQLTLLGRRPIPNIAVDFVQQHTINIFETDAYANYLT